MTHLTSTVGMGSNRGGRRRGGRHLVLLALAMVLAIAIAGALIPADASAATRAVTAAFSDFDSAAASAFQFNGVAAHVSSANALRLTPNSSYAAGSAFFRQPVRLGEDRSFSTFFKLNMHDAPSTRADGMTFTLASSPSVLGSRGGGLGYANIGKSVAVEFDTFHNNGYNSGDNATYADPNNNHIGININGDMTSKATMLPSFTLYGAPLYVWVDYDGATMEVRISRSATRPGAPSLSYKVDLSAVVGDVVYPGFTAGTGSLTTLHDAEQWYFNAESVAEGIDPSQAAFVAAPEHVSVTHAGSGTVGANGTVRLTARFTDATGQPVTGWPATFSVVEGTIFQETAKTDESGLITAVYTAPPTAGSYSVAVGGGTGASTTYVLGVTEPVTREPAASDPVEPSNETTRPSYTDERSGMITGDVEVSAVLGISVTGTSLHYGMPAQGTADVPEVYDQHTIITNHGDVLSGLFIQGDGPARGDDPAAQWQMAAQAGEDAFVWRFAHPEAGVIGVVPESASPLGSLGYNDSLDFSSSIDMPTFSSHTGKYRWSATVWATAPE